ncbi:hypothetical protein DL96DRAFT_1616636 [Flagelloscypha sp. PMI_526]|nr:hypothetical protein DL96DRAFT_1616636 [Flagelloscypha sp. PMI_526]
MLLRKVTLGCWFEANESWTSALDPITTKGQPLPLIRTLEVHGMGSSSSSPLNIPLSSIIPQLEHLLIDVHPSPSVTLISQLNTQNLRTLKLGQLGEEMSFPTFCRTFAGEDSPLEELSITMTLISAGSMEQFPVFPHLKSLMLFVSDWNTTFLTRIPTCAPVLESLGLYANTGIAISNDVMLLVWDIYGDRQCTYLIKENIEQLECPDWDAWGLKSVEMVGTGLVVGGMFKDEMLWTPMKAFVSKVPSLRYWMRETLTCVEAEQCP